MINAFIIEDELRGLENLKNLLGQYCPEVKVIGEAQTLESGLNQLSNPAMKPDVAFLDINLPDGLIFSLLSSLKKIEFLGSLDFHCASGDH